MNSCFVNSSSYGWFAGYNFCLVFGITHLWTYFVVHIEEGQPNPQGMLYAFLSKLYDFWVLRLHIFCWPVSSDWSTRDMVTNSSEFLCLFVCFYPGQCLPTAFSVLSLKYVTHIETATVNSSRCRNWIIIIVKFVKGTCFFNAHLFPWVRSGKSGTAL